MQKRYLLRIMRYQNDINTEHNMKSVCRAAVARVRNWKGANILLLQYYYK